MSIKSDKWIRKMSLQNKMIDPFIDSQVKEESISYGLSSYGYDIRVSDEYKLETSSIKYFPYVIIFDLLNSSYTGE